MPESSFDVVSDFERQELVNAVDQALREMRTRYDLKGSNSSLELGQTSIRITASSEHIVRSILDVLETKMVRRGLSLKILSLGEVVPAAGGAYRLEIELRRGINADLARDINRLLRGEFPKLKVTVQGDAVRVSGKSKDELQKAIAVLKSRDYPVPLQFVNYR